MSDAYETVIGLECHVELSTATKMFCGCRNEFGAEPNTRVCEVCLGSPGSLPVPNERAIEFAIRIGLALGSSIASPSYFHRKNYFYPDMPKNFQISQYDLPICVGGHLDVEVDGETRRIGITRAHLEEDTGKTAHAGTTGRIAEAEYALVDYNRAGVPLVEIVSEPDLRSPEEARAYLTELRDTLEALGVSDVRMEEGSLRADANVSVRPVGSTDLGTKVEIKNLNSIRSLERALRYEAERQRTALTDGTPLVQETRHWDEERGVTLPLRSKEYAFDYRYFPEPDLPPVAPDPAWVERIGSELPELPAARRARFAEAYDLTPAQVAQVAGSREWADFFEAAVSFGAEPKLAANWLTQDIAAVLNETRRSLAETELHPKHLAELTEQVRDGSVSATGAKQLIDDITRRVNDRVEAPVTVVWTDRPSSISVVELLEEKGLRQVSDESALLAMVDEAIAENPGPAEQFRAGKEGAIGFLVGQVMKKSKGSANPKLAQDLLRRRLT